MSDTITTDEVLDIEGTAIEAESETVIEGTATISRTVTGEIFVPESIEEIPEVELEGEVYIPQTGANGYSAYELAVLNGFVGTYEEWRDSLKGEKGDTLVFEDLTPEQKEELRGDPLEFEDLTPEEKEEIRGMQGEQGFSVVSVRVEEVNDPGTEPPMAPYVVGMRLIEITE